MTTLYDFLIMLGNTPIGRKNSFFETHKEFFVKLENERKTNQSFFKDNHQASFEAYKHLYNSENVKFGPIIALINILLAHRQRNINFSVIKALMVGFMDFLKTEDEIKGFENYQILFHDNSFEMNPNEILFMCTPLKLPELKNKENFIKITNSLLIEKSDTKLDIAIKMVCKLKLQPLFNIKDLCLRALRAGLAELIDNLVENDVQLAEFCLKNMKPETDGKVMKNIIKSRGIDPKLYPKLLTYQRESLFRYLFKTGDVEKAELITKSTDTNADMEVLVNFLIKTGHKDNAFSIYSRNKSMITTPSLLQKIKELQNPIYIENSLIANDAFLPLSVIQGVKDNFLTWADFGVTEDAYRFIDTKNLAEGIDLLKNGKILGLDCEFFSNDCTNFNLTRISTLQVFDSKIIAIYDCKNLVGNKEFFEALKNCLEDPNIIKIGHSFSTDLQLLEETFPFGKITPSNLNNVETMIPTKLTMGLASMCDRFFNKKLCKKEQTGPWGNRPLRKAQVHYAGLDSIVLIEMYRKITTMIEADKQNLFSGEKGVKVEDPILIKEDPLIPAEEIQTGDNIQKESVDFQIEQYQDVEVEEQPEIIVVPAESDIPAKPLYYRAPTEQSMKYSAFLVDQTNLKLIFALRNIGINADTVKSTLPDVIVERAVSQNRAIITLKKYFPTSKGGYILTLDSRNTDDQISEIISHFNLKISKENLMSRCVKCNSSELIIVDSSTADQFMEKSNIIKPKEVTEYWMCNECNQVYWEGGQFKKAKNQYSKFINS